MFAPISLTVKIPKRSVLIPLAPLLSAAMKAAAPATNILMLPRKTASATAPATAMIIPPVVPAPLLTKLAIRPVVKSTPPVCLAPPLCQLPRSAMKITNSTTVRPAKNVLRAAVARLARPTRIAASVKNALIMFAPIKAIPKTPKMNAL